MASIFDWSASQASNASVGSINWAEGMAPSAVNDSARYTMADVAMWRDLLGGAKISSGTNTITLTSGLSLSAYAQGMMFAFEAGGANTGAATLNVDSIGAKDIKKYHDVALASGDLEAAGIYLVCYEATADNFQLLSAVSNAPLTTSDVGVSVAPLTAAATFTAGMRGEITALSDGATITPDMADSNNFSVTLGGNRTLANPSNLTAGQSGSIFITQDGTGSRTLSYGSYWDFAGGTAPTLTTTAAAVDRLDYVVRSASSIHTVFTATYS